MVKFTDEEKEYIETQMNFCIDYNVNSCLVEATEGVEHDTKIAESILEKVRKM